MNLLLLGKPNVGKTSIYNILTETKSNIVHSSKGTTRDWHINKLKKIENISVFDTPGILYKKDVKNYFKTTLIFKSLLKKTDIFLYVIDYNSIFDLEDCEFINELRKFNKRIVLLINKFDNFKQILNDEYHKYGIKNVFFISCSHNLGFSLFYNFLNKNYLIKKNTKDLENNFSIAIVGKPNAGKSTFFNSFVGYERSITSSKAGTTSDYVQDYFIFKKNKIMIFDTAGIKRKSKVINNSVNFYSIKKSFEKINQIDAALIIIDSENGIDRQDKRIINIVTNKAKSIIIIFNKIDLIKNKEKYKKETVNEIENSLFQIKNVKVFFCSAFLKSHIENILNYLLQNVFYKKYKIKTSKLNSWLKIAISQQKHPLIENKKVNFKYAVQINEHPITIKIFCNFSNKLKQNYKRFLTNDFNKFFNIINQKTKLIFSRAKNPYI